MNIDLHQLEVSVEVSRTRNVARAADNLGLTSSPVSRTLRTLEHRTGPLFHRAHHDMQLTEHGRTLLGTAVSILQLSQVFEDKASGIERTLRYGATPWVPDAYADAFRTAVGLSGITPEDAASEVSLELLNKLQFGEIDMALVHLPVNLPDISSLVIGRYTFDLMVAADDPLITMAETGPVPLAALRGRKVVTLPFSQMQPASGDNVHDWFSQAGVTDITEVGFSDYAVLTSRLPRTHEVSIGARGHSLGHVRGADGKVVMLPVADEQPCFEIGVVWRSGATARREDIDRVVAALTDRFRS
ncbi:LysR family transcriptional regulator [Corynebacterium glyciniphilum]|uniref:LysR family transcriptional regulator n=1 Tax=Corynebacterium glyciniphilum TaxID=1404244 RepID=UPI003DA04308